MAIPTLAEVKAAVTAAEIAPFEAAIKAYLETAQMVAYLENGAATHIVIRTFEDAELTTVGVAALKAAIEAAGWTAVVVENRFGPVREGIGISQGPAKKQVFVSFKPGAATPPEGGGA